MRSYILLTDESEKYVKDVLWSLLPLEEGEELIIFDNMSKDATVPVIVGVMGDLWLDPTQRYKFYINKKKEDIEIVKKKALSIAKYKPIIIEKKEKFDIKEVLEDVKNKWYRNNNR